MQSNNNRKKETNKLALIAFLFGVILLLTNLLIGNPIFSYVASFLGIFIMVIGLFGIIQISESKKSKRQQSGIFFAIFGLIFGLLSIMPSALNMALIKSRGQIKTPVTSRQLKTAPQKALVASAKSNVRRIYVSCVQYYAENMEIPETHVFNDCSEPNSTWYQHPDDDFFVARPPGKLAFTYKLIKNGDEFEVIANPEKSYIEELRDYTPIKTEKGGAITGGRKKWP